MTARAKLPGDIYEVPVTLFVLVDARGATPEAMSEDAKTQASKWAGEARHEVGEPKVFS